MRDLLDDLGALSAKPLAFVMWAFPWGEPATELESLNGPEAWQRELLIAVGQGLLDLNQAIRIAATSGHGVGKSALVSWLILWAISTFPHTRGVVTANTEAQLKGKTWAELGKWHRLFIANELFKLTATALYNRDHERTWRIDMVPWSETNSEAFAGLHNKYRRILVIFDEASNIPDTIWETTEGALTDSNTQIIWGVFGNPTKNSGRFRECFGKYRHRWHTIKVDSRTVSITNKKQHNEWIEDYGLDSDFVKVRVLGEFPNSSDLQFISTALVEDALKREVEVHPHDPLIIGVDVARFGSNASVVFPRKGRDARSIPWMEFRGIDTMALAMHVAQLHLQLKPDAIFVDEGGVGGGVVDRLRQLKVPCIGVQFGGKPIGLSIDDGRTKFLNRRSEIWGAMRSWLKTGALPPRGTLREQLIGPSYAINPRDEIVLEAKKDMEERGLESPDHADALALTFALPVIPSEYAGGLNPRRPNVLKDAEYDPFSAESLAA